MRNSTWDSGLFDRQPAFALQRTPHSNPSKQHRRSGSQLHDHIYFSFPFSFFLFHSVCVCIPVIHSGLVPIFIQRILSINLDMSLSCLASLNSSVVSQFNAEAPLHPTPLPKKKEKLRCYSPFLSGCFSEVSHLCVLIHICVSFI